MLKLGNASPQIRFFSHSGAFFSFIPYKMFFFLIRPVFLIFTSCAYYLFSCSQYKQRRPGNVCMCIVRYRIDAILHPTNDKCIITCFVWYGFPQCAIASERLPFFYLSNVFVVLAAAGCYTMSVFQGRNNVHRLYLSAQNSAIIFIIWKESNLIEANCCFQHSRRAYVDQCSGKRLKTHSWLWHWFIYGKHICFTALL